MPQLSSHASSTVTKMLFIGDSGSGKTGALASLAQAGYNLRILDLDSGLDVLSNLLRDPKSPYGAEALARVTYETLTDPMQAVAGKLVPKKATVWQRAIQLLQHWRVEKPRGPAVMSSDGKPVPQPVEYEYDLGPLVTWGPRDILVIDSLTMLSTAALNFVLSMNVRLGQQPHQSDWYTGQQMIESLLQMLYDENVRCNIILISHISYIGEENGPQHGYPASLGKALSPKIGRYFNTCVMAKTQGAGAAVKRKILTNSTQMVELKTSNPINIKPEYDLASGLAEIFTALRGAPPK